MKDYTELLIDEDSDFEEMFAREYETETLYDEQYTYQWKSRRPSDKYKELNFE